MKLKSSMRNTVTDLSSTRRSTKDYSELLHTKRSTNPMLSNVLLTLNETEIRKITQKESMANIDSPDKNLIERKLNDTVWKSNRNHNIVFNKFSSNVYF